MEEQNARGLAARVSHLVPEGAYEVLSKARALEARGHEVIHLEIGQPDVPTFDNVAQAGILAIEEGRTRYNPPRGVDALREAIAEDAGRRRGMTVSPTEVVVAPGAKPMLFFPTMTLVEPGDEVIYPDPGFPTYAAMIGVARGVPVPVALREETGFAFDLEAFDRAVSDRTRLIILNSPSNPTGGVLPEPVLRHVAEAAQRHGAWVLSDEIYMRLTYDGTSAPSIAALDGMRERTVICDGFSKTYAMTGWRLGYGVMPEALAEQLGLLLTHSIGCTATFTQYAGLEALTGPQEQVDAVVAEYQRRRDVLVEGLNELAGVHCRKPQGAFYAFPNTTAFGRSSDWMADYLLEAAGVAVLPGTAFGVAGEGYLRLCFANSMEDIKAALRRIENALGRLERA
ncbi:MAG: pyridoxal phosphate-dependent aminotransferase [Anaerolineae bacterium]|jgi:aspartate/methionine/tyrosine aminotransferase